MDRTRAIIKTNDASVHAAAERISRAIAEFTALTTAEKVMIAIGSLAGAIAGESIAATAAKRLGLGSDLSNVVAVTLGGWIGGLVVEKMIRNSRIPMESRVQL